MTLYVVHTARMLQDAPTTCLQPKQEGSQGQKAHDGGYRATLDHEQCKGQDPEKLEWDSG